jgi:MFS family permease
MSESLCTSAADDAESPRHSVAGVADSSLLQRGRGEPERTRRVIFFLTVVWFVPLIMWFPAYTQYVLARRCSALMATGEATSCGSSVVSASAAQWSTWCLSTCNLCGALSALALGKLADRYGRRPMLMLNAGSQVFGSLGLLLVVLFEGPLALLLPFFFVNGLGGGTPVFVALSLGVLADDARDEPERGKLFGQVTAVNFICGWIAPFIGGQLTKPGGIGELSSSLYGGPFQLVYVLFFLGNLTVCACEYALLPETLSADAIAQAKRKPFSYWQTTFGSLEILKIEPIRDLFMIYCMVVLALDPMTNLEILFAYLNFPDLAEVGGTQFVGNFISGNGFCRAISVLVLYPLVLKNVQGERRSLVYALRTGILILICVTATFGLFDSGSSHFALQCIFAVGGFDAMWQSAIATLFSLVGEEHGIGQGQVLSLQSFAGGAFYTISPLIFNTIWAFTVARRMPGFTFHVITACALGGLMLTKRVKTDGGGSNDGTSQHQEQVAEAVAVVALPLQEKPAAAEDAIGYVPPVLEQ